MPISKNMNQKNFFKQLAKSLLKESGVELEKESKDSVDAQIDHYFNDYEVEAKSEVKESRDWRMTVRRILEADDDEEKKEDSHKLEEDAINIESFTNSIMRLIENAESLLELRNTILRRASNFLMKNYKQEVVEKFKDTLLDSFGIEIGKSKLDVDEKFTAPPADRAGDTSTGG